MRIHPFVPTLVVSSALLASGCSIQEQTPPSISGPSSFAQTFTVTTSPETLTRNGAAESTITVVVRTSAGEPVPSQRILLSANAPTGTTFSASEVTTDASGHATVSVTAPPSTSVGNLISVGLTPVDANGVQTQVVPNVLIGVTPANASAPAASFTFSPASPGINDTITFNAGASTDEGVTCGATCTYAWNFGDGSTATGMIVTKAFASAGTKTVTLTVTDAGGAVSPTATQAIAVSTGTITPTITVSPTNPRTTDTVRFDGRSSTASGGATITDYEWDFGNGGTATGPTASTTYSTTGTYTIRLTIRDNLGRSATTTITLAVAAP